ncbi:MAG: dihydroorotase [Cytophagaceae bacterium]
MKLLIKNAFVVNEGVVSKNDVLIIDKRIEKIQKSIKSESDWQIIDASGMYLIPGLIDTHVHFREPGLTYKGTIESESMAAIAGGVTSFMDMPNTRPNTTTIDLLEEKYALASKSSYANYSFYFGLNSENFETAICIDNSKVCGLTDDGLYFDNNDSLMCNNLSYIDKLFSRSKSLIALHCEDESIIQKNEKLYFQKYGSLIPPEKHALIRNDVACFDSTKRVVDLAKKYNSRLHILHLSTGIEVDLFSPLMDVRNKRITVEACMHHLYFNTTSYTSKGNQIKWNPSIKSENDRQALINGLNNGYIDNIATDHAPHTIMEKSGDYFSCMSGAPSIQHLLPVLLTLRKKGELSIESIVQKTSHNPAEIFRIKQRGYIREGYYADLVLIDLNHHVNMDTNKLYYKVGWSPFDNDKLQNPIRKVIVNGAIVLDEDGFTGQKDSMRLQFDSIR